MSTIIAKSDKVIATAYNALSKVLLGKSTFTAVKVKGQKTTFPVVENLKEVVKTIDSIVKDPKELQTLVLDYLNDNTKKSVEKVAKIENFESYSKELEELGNKLLTKAQYIEGLQALKDKFGLGKKA